MPEAELNLNTIREKDKSDMLGLLLDFPRQCRNAYEIAGKAEIKFGRRGFKKVIFSGLGGSAIGADLARAYLFFKINLPVSVYREYDLPACVDNEALVFVCSYSGNTEETLSAYRQAKEKGATLVLISSDGALKDDARKENLTFIEIPQGLPPRCALGYLSIVPLGVLARLGLCEDIGPALNEAVAVLEELKDNSLNPHIAQKENIAKSVAQKLFNKFTVIYSGSIHFDVAAVRFRGQLAENAKALASSHVFPEMNHNEIVGWQHPKELFKDFTVVMLRDAKVHPRVALRMDITGGIIKKEGVNFVEIWSRGEGLLSRIFSLIYIGDFISFYLAILYGIDPTPVDRITYLKNKLAESK